ncbi:MAG: hypothetical protein NVSMB48_25470 [Marmoricola sp.]
MVGDIGVRPTDRVIETEHMHARQILAVHTKAVRHGRSRVGQRERRVVRADDGIGSQEMASFCRRVVPNGGVDIGAMPDPLDYSGGARLTKMPIAVSRA